MLRIATSHALHVIGEVLLGIAGLVALAGCVLAWRLAQGPIDVTALAQAEQGRLGRHGAHLTVAHAALAWEGFSNPGAPIDIRWRGLLITAPDGTVMARLPEGRVSLAAAPLLVGAIVPRSVVLDGPSLALRRGVDGSVMLDLGEDTPLAPTTGTGRSGSGAAQLLRDLVGNGGDTPALPFLRQLRTVRITGAAVALRDEASGVLWQARPAEIVLNRTERGDVEGQAEAHLRADAVRLDLAAQLAIDRDGMRIRAQSSPVSPAVLARAVPGMQAGAAIDAPVRTQLDVAFGPDLSLRHASLDLQAGAGTIIAGRGQVAIAGIDASARIDGTRLSVGPVRVTLQPAPGAHLPPPPLSFSAEAARRSGKLVADFTATIGRTSFADLPSYWPEGTGGGARPWIVQNIMAGTAQDGHVSGTVSANPDFTGVTLDALSGGLSGTDLSLAWLRPVPGLEHVDAVLTVQGPDALLITVPRARQLVPSPNMSGQASGQIAVSNGSIRITGLMEKDQFGDIALDAKGALPDVLALLNHKRLRLLSRRPFPMADPAGQAEVHLRLRLPLDDRVTMDQIGIKATATATDVHLGGVAAGRDLDHGQIALTVDADSLAIQGQGDVDALPARFRMDMDFRNGPPDQVLEHVTAVATPGPAQLTRAGLPGGVLTAGQAAITVEYKDRRNGTGEVAMDADLTKAAITTPIGWSKAAGPAASASARLRLDHGRIVAIDGLQASGPDLQVASHVVLSTGQQTVLVLDRVHLGRTEARGSIGLPRKPEDKLRLALSGRALDISALLKRQTGGSRAADRARRGQRWVADLKFDRVILSADEVLSPVSVDAESDGLHIERARVSAGTRGEVTASITPVQGGRTLKIDSADSGAVLLASGIADNIRGGRLRVDGVYDDALPDAPLHGTARLAQFRILNAPAIGRLLKAMTLYGAVDLLRGPGLGFQEMVAPFRFADQVLTLDGARAYSASLGLTAKGTIDLLKRTADVTGTVVPAYFFNQLPGQLPIVGKLFSPEKGGGVFAARYAVRGKLADPKVSVNALSALTPGFLRGLFGLL